MADADDFPTDPKRSIFAVCYGDALEAITQGMLPEWIADLNQDGHFDRICREFALPTEARDELIAAVCALDTCLATPTPDEAPTSRKAQRALFAQLAGLRASLDNLNTSAVPSLLVDFADDQTTPQGDATFEFTPGVVPRLRNVVDEAMAAIDNVATRAGRRPGYISYAITVLTAIVDRYQPAMPSGRRAALADELFAEIRSRHGHKSRKPNPDIDDVPRSIDMVRRVAKRTAGGP